jgi:heme-degrading monooxygenase HmoA
MVKNMLYTQGVWRPAAGKEDVFVEAWALFAGWASGMPGAGTLHLARDVRNVERFVSFGRWDSADAVRAWKSHPEFRERIARVLQHVDEFEPTELSLVATADAGVGTVEPVPLRIEPIHAP